METASYILFAAFLIVVGVGAAIGNSRRARFNSALSKAAPLVGLSYREGNAAIDEAERDAADEGPAALKIPRVLTRFFGGGVTPCLAGEYKGVHVKVFSESGSPGGGKPAETTWRAYYRRPLHFKLRAVSRHSTDEQPQASSELEFTLGDEEFDAKVRLESDDMVEARAFLAESNRRQALLAGFSAYPSIVVRKASVVCKRLIAEPSPKEIQAVLDSIVGIARTF